MNKIQSVDLTDEEIKYIKKRYSNTSFTVHKDFLDRKAHTLQRYLTFGESAKNYLYSSYGNIPVLAKKRMENAKLDLYPYLEVGLNPAKNVWYLLGAVGESPSLRVGFTATTLGRKVLFIGGANPHETFSDGYELDLDNLTWDTLDEVGFLGRYEHCAFSCNDTDLLVWGGAQVGKNLTDMQQFNIQNKTWKNIECTGSCPSARTCHGLVGKNGILYVYSGGHQGADPVGDRQVYCFDSSTKVWTVLRIVGDTPKPRHGHVLAEISDSKVILHGGMAGSKFYDDLHILDLKKNKWNSVKCTGRTPCGRAAHAGVIYHEKLFIFGGLTSSGSAIDDLWRFDLSTSKWTEITMDGPHPPPRLDMASCVITINVWKNNEQNDEKAKDIVKEVIRSHIGSAPSSAGSQRSVSSLLAENTVEDEDVTPRPPPEVTEEDTRNAATGSLQIPLLLFCGGMDTEGNIFDDCYICSFD